MKEDKFIKEFSKTYCPIGFTKKMGKDVHTFNEHQLAVIISIFLSEYKSKFGGVVSGKNKK